MCCIVSSDARCDISIAFTLTLTRAFTFTFAFAFVFTFASPDSHSNSHLLDSLIYTYIPTYTYSLLCLLLIHTDG